MAQTLDLETVSKIRYESNTNSPVWGFGPKAGPNRFCF